MSIISAIVIISVLACAFVLARALLVAITMDKMDREMEDDE